VSQNPDFFHLVAGLAAALRAGALTTDAAAAEVTSLTERRLAHLSADTRPLPSVAIYDQLLPSRRIPREGTAEPAAPSPRQVTTQL
jgi:hypothetical protein